ncbi:hypothetical protein KVR01_007863 [Diaporthe batatas]|uniref:uncharacterized protein n=1 Tax=Diaporthe batatas TaxID=748121 RepID=UPI001D042B23|nr:uncharacterized protein KVR01_007863 [Diaporthe batatas]KAG8162098.1 hypothetical protein KVR01_007863 [Diaporthe batatas]
MYESSPRSREVEKALFQLDRLAEDQTRAVLRHIIIDDAVMNEAQCSHVASLINGTLQKVPREGVNATLTCATGFEAASHWEKSYASHPGHVSATFRKNSVNGENEADKSKQVVLFKPKKTAPALAKNESADVKPSFGATPDVKGLTIVNQGQMTLHYHSYNHAPSPAPQTPAVPRKRSLDKAEDEEYSEALASLMKFDLSPESRRDPTLNPKRQRLEKPDIEMLEPEAPKAQDPVKQEKEQPVQKDKKKKKRNQKKLPCKKCGKSYKGPENKGSKTPCRSHPGVFIPYPIGVWPKGNKGKGTQPLYAAWSCCKTGLNTAGCVFGKHERQSSS